MFWRSLSVVLFLSSVTEGRRLFGRRERNESRRLVRLSSSSPSPLESDTYVTLFSPEWGLFTSAPTNIKLWMASGFHRLITLHINHIIITLSLVRLHHKLSMIINTFNYLFLHFIYSFIHSYYLHKSDHLSVTHRPLFCGSAANFKNFVNLVNTF